MLESIRKSEARIYKGRKFILQQVSTYSFVLSCPGVRLWLSLPQLTFGLPLGLDYLEIEDS
jgi:hypothetical protein